MWYAAIVALVVGFGGGWLSHGWKTDSATLKTEQKQEKVEDKAAVEHEEFKAKEVIKYRTITKTVEKIVKEPFYLSGACLDDDGVRAVNDAIGKAPSQPASTVPAAPHP